MFRLVVWELRKLLQLPALWGFLALCLVLNGALIFSMDQNRESFNAASHAAGQVGQRVDDTFSERLAGLPDFSNQDSLQEAVSGMTDIFETYDVQALAARYVSLVENSPLAVQWMTAKYEKVGARVAHLASADAALDLYAGPATHDSHQFLFGTLLHAVVGEGGVLAMLAALYLLGFESMQHTEPLTYSTRTGRRLHRTKLFAACLSSLVLYGLLLLPTLGLYFSLWDYSGVWSASVSSQFNYIIELLAVKPFLTWADFTVAGYLTASVALGGLLVLVSCLMAALLGTLIPHTYGSALFLILIWAGMMGAAAVASNAKLWILYFITTLQPLLLWFNQGGWFTELGINAVWPWHEVWGTFLSLLLWGGGVWAALRRFDRKDLMGWKF